MKYTNKIVDKICIAIKEHRGRLEACNDAGISFRTFRNWMDKYPKFKEAIEDAEEETLLNKKILAEQAITTKFYDSWQAAAWFLERKFPDEYGRYDKQKIIGDKQNPIHLDVNNGLDYSKLTNEQLKVLFEISESQGSVG